MGMKYKGMEHPPETQVWLLNLGWMVEDGVEDPWGGRLKYNGQSGCCSHEEWRTPSDRSKYEDP